MSEKVLPPVPGASVSIAGVFIVAVAVLSAILTALYAFQQDAWRELLSLSSAENGSIAVRQNVRVYASRLDAGQSAALALPSGRHLWTQVLRGDVDVNGKALTAGDGLAASGETEFRFTAGKTPAELLAFDLA